MTDQELYEIRTVCRLCGRRFKHLGSHLAQKHKITANDYKKDLGINLNISLCDDSVVEKQRQHALEHIDTIKETFEKNGAKHRIKKGQKIEGRYLSDQKRRDMAVIYLKREKVEKICKQCGKVCHMVRLRKYCDDCQPAIKFNNRHKEERLEWYRQYHRKRMEDPEYRKANAKRHRDWVAKNRERVNEYQRLWTRKKISA